MRQPRPKADVGLRTRWGKWPQRRGCSARGHWTGHSRHPSQISPLVASPAHARPLHSILSRPPWTPQPGPPACHCPVFAHWRPPTVPTLHPPHPGLVSTITGQKWWRAQSRAAEVRAPSWAPSPWHLPMGAALSLCLPSRGAAWAHRGCPGGKEVRIGCAGGEGSESREDSEMEGEEGWMQEGVWEQSTGLGCGILSLGPARQQRRYPKHQRCRECWSRGLRTLNPQGRPVGDCGDRGAEDETWDTTPHAPRGDRRTTEPWKWQAWGRIQESELWCERKERRGPEHGWSPQSRDGKGGAAGLPGFLGHGARRMSYRSKK